MSDCHRSNMKSEECVSEKLDLFPAVNKVTICEIYKLGVSKGVCAWLQKDRPQYPSYLRHINLNVLTNISCSNPIYHHLIWIVTAMKTMHTRSTLNEAPRIGVQDVLVRVTRKLLISFTILEGVKCTMPSTWPGGNDTEQVKMLQRLAC